MVMAVLAVCVVFGGGVVQALPRHRAEGDLIDKNIQTLEREVQDDINKEHQSTIVLKPGVHAAEASHRINPDETHEDMILTHAQKVVVGLESERPGDEFDKLAKRKIETSIVRLWDNGVVPWVFKWKPKQSSRDAVLEAIQEWEKMTCLRFPQRTTEKYYVRIDDRFGCSSSLGWSYGYQYLNIGSCIEKGIVVHEFGHTIGFVHEQKRSDRDDFVEILTDNIRRGLESQFKKVPSTTDVEYDLESIMHYSLYAWSSNGKPTIRVKSAELDFLPGQRSGLTFYDAKMANIAYNCKGNCSLSCHNHGYPFKRPDGSCVCRCPRGLSGDCNSLDDSFADCGGVYQLNAEGDNVTIVSPNYPSNYDVDKTCVYVIKAHDAPNSGIILHFEDFEVSDGVGDNCQHSLEINANLIGQTGVKYCGVYDDAPHEAHTFLDHNSKEVMLIFDTHGRASAAKGFKFTARATTHLDPCLDCKGARKMCTITGAQSICECRTGLAGNNCDIVTDPSTISCNFDNGLMLCSWEQTDTDDFDWSVYKGSTPTDDSGPSSSPDNSAYLYIEASYPVRAGQKAVLETLFIEAGTYCFAFKYHMYGKTMGELKLDVEPTQGNSIQLFNKRGNQGDAWKEARMTVYQKSQFKLRLTGIKGSSRYSDIAVEDLSFTPGSCDGTADFCEDKHDTHKCRKWANTGECKRNPEWMATNCRKSCGCGDSGDDTDAGRCRDIHDRANCKKWASDGECDKTPAWMLVNCKKSCGDCRDSNDDGDTGGNCRDIHDTTKCGNWAASGECEKNPDWMRENCKKSCDNCGGGGGGKVGGGDNICKDTHDSTKCRRWSEQGECEKNPTWMSANCKKSCNNCDSTDGGGTNGACVDKFDLAKCRSWAATGECKTNPSWMLDNCQKSCNNCGGEDGRDRKRGDDNECLNTHDTAMCDMWANSGECKRNPQFMLTSCRKSCGCDGGDTGGTDGKQGVDDCVNVHATNKCDGWANTGECETNPSWMIANCKKSCVCDREVDKRSGGGGGDGVNDCKNVHTSAECDVWASTGACKKNPDWMLPNCKKSCGCGESDGGDNGGGGTSGGKCVNSHNNAECEAWAKEGECNKNPWMLDNCKLSCGCGECVNIHGNSAECDDWAAKGECDNNPTWMLKNCRRSCGCDGGKSGSGKTGGGDCSNSHGNDAECNDWATTEQCDANPKWMKVNCKKSCGVCGGSGATSGGETDAGGCVNLHKNDHECKTWAENGECATNPTWMLDHCRKSCSCGGDGGNVNVGDGDGSSGNDRESGDCTNTHTNGAQCEDWATQGECKSNPSWMLANCKKSCGCKDKAKPEVQQGACENVHSDDQECDTWARTGQCDTNPEWMMRNCRRACGQHICHEKKCRNDGGEATCSWKVAKDKCSTDGEYMLKMCRLACACGGSPTVETKTPTTKKSKECKNTWKGEDRDCQVWATGGECTRNPSFMMESCYKACSKCGGSKECTNTHGNDRECEAWKKLGYCATNPTWMKSSCAKSCGSCGDGTTGTRVTTTKDDEGCADQNDNCASWASHGQCSVNPGYMHESCKKSCNICSGQDGGGTETGSSVGGKVSGDCQDKWSECPAWAKGGSCSSNPGFMLPNCPLSCGQCTSGGGTTSCRDTSVNCAAWKQANACLTNRSTMKEYCPLTCGLCEGSPGEPIL